MNINFAGFLVSLIISILAFLVVGAIMGFFASLSVPVLLALCCWLYWTIQQKNASQCVQIESFGGYLFRVEVA